AERRLPKSSPGGTAPTRERLRKSLLAAAAHSGRSFSAARLTPEPFFTFETANPALPVHRLSGEHFHPISDSLHGALDGQRHWPNSRSQRCTNDRDGASVRTQSNTQNRFVV